MTPANGSKPQARSGELSAMLFLLALLIGSYALLSVAALLWPTLGLEASLRGRISLAAVFVFTALGHFLKAREMAEMLPPAVPLRVPIIYATGVVELGLAAGLPLAAAARTAGLAVISFLILVFPANVSAAMRRVDFGGHGRGPSYLILRAPLQLLLIAWAYWFAVR